MNKQDSLKPNSPCDELSNLLPAYAAGALSAEEVEHVKALLKDCPEMQSEAAEYAALMSGFYDRIEPVAPPKSLHRSLMRKLHERNTAAHDGENPDHKDHELIVATRTDIHDDQVK